MKKYFEDLLRILNDSLMSIDENVFEALVDNCVDTLSNGNKLVVTGLGKNVPVCDKFIGTLNSLGIKAAYMNTNSAIHGDIGLVNDGDLVIFLTKSGETVESIYLYDLLKERNCTIWLLTFKKQSTLSTAIKNSLIIHLEHEGDKWNVMPNNSTTLNLIVLQMLAMRIADKLDVPLEVFKRNHPGGHIGVILNER